MYIQLGQKTHQPLVVRVLSSRDCIQGVGLPSSTIQKCNVFLLPTMITYLQVCIERGRKRVLWEIYFVEIELRDIRMVSLSLEVSLQLCTLFKE